MPVPWPTVQNIEDFLQNVEETVISSVSSATADMPSLKQAFERLWRDIDRFGPWQSLPSLPDIKMPGLGAFEVPPPPPPPPAPIGFMEKTANWVGSHPWKTAFIGIGLVGAGIAVGYGGVYMKGTVKSRKVRATSSMHANAERRQVVVVLGGDSPLGLPLILGLEKEGYIVIVSVSTPEAVEIIEGKSQGYVRAILLDPSEPETIQYFLRSLASTMSRRFPMTATGDPHSSPATQTYVQSVISLLTLPPADLIPPPGPLESLALRDSYFTYLQATHFTPLHVFQALMPLLRNSPARTRDEVSRNKGKRSIIVCLPAKDARVGLPFSGAQAMSAAATLRGAEVLRREIRAAATTDVAMRNIKVVTVDVGSVGGEETFSSEPSFDHAMIDWTASEKSSYGPAFASVFGEAKRRSLGRKPSDVSAFVRVVVDVVNNGKRRDKALSDIDLIFGRLREWLFGDRAIVGAGAWTYALASSLPSLILDMLLNLPQTLMSLRNALLPIPPPAVLPYPPPKPPPAAAPAPNPAASSSAQRRPLSERTQAPAPVDSDSDHQLDTSSEAGSEADVESNEGSGVGESWVSLQKDQP